MTDTVKLLVELLKDEEAWIDPEYTKVDRVIKGLQEASTQVLERMFLGTIGADENSRKKTIDFCLNVVMEEMGKVLVEIEKKEKEYQDPITLELMRDPVNLHATGQLYERKPLERHLKIKKTCPMTGKKIDKPDFSPCVSIKSHIDKFVFETLDRTKHFGTVSIELLKVLNIGVYNISEYPLRNSFDQVQEFEELIKRLDQVLVRVVLYDEDNMEILRILESCYFLSANVPKLLEVRRSMVNVMNRKEELDDSNRFLETKIIQTGLIQTLKNEDSDSSDGVYQREKEEILNLSFQHHLKQKDFPKIILAIRRIASFFVEINNTSPCYRYLKEAERVLSRDRSFLIFLSKLFQSGPYRNKKRSSRIYYHLAVQFEDEGRYFEEVKDLFEVSIQLNSKNQKAKDRYAEFMEQLRSRTETIESTETTTTTSTTETKTPKEEIKGSSSSSSSSSRIRKIEEEDHEKEEDDGEEEEEESSSSSDEETEEERKRKKNKKKKKVRRRSRKIQKDKPITIYTTRKKSNKSHKKVKKRLESLTSSTSDEKKKLEILERAYQIDPDSEYLCRELAKLYQRQGQLSKIIEITEEKHFCMVSNNNVDEEEEEDVGITEDEVFTFKNNLRTELLLETIDKTNKKVEKLKDVLVKISKDFNRKLRILNIQYKDVRTHIQQQQENNIPSTSTPLEQKKTKKKKKKVEGMKASQISKRAHVLRFTKLKPGEKSGVEKFEMGGIKFKTRLEVTDGVQVKLKNWVEVPDLIDDEYKLTVEFKTMVETKFISKLTKIILFTEFSYYSDAQWLFKFHLEKMK